MEKQEKKTVWQKIVSFFPILPAIAVLAIVVGALSGYKPNTYSVHAQAQQNEASAQAVVGAAANVADGKYTGSAQGFKSTITVEVTVKNHKITAIDVKSENDTPNFFSRAKNGVIPAIIEKQSTDVDVVSGATYSSNGIKNAVKNALGQKTSSSSSAARGYSSAKKNTTVQAPPAGSTYKDGTYTGSAQGFNGLVTVAVTIKDNKITSVQVKSNSDTPHFFNNAKNKVIPEIVKNNSTKVDGYTGATYSSNGIKNATANALNKAVVKGSDSVKKASAGQSKAAAATVTAAPAKANLKDGTYTVTTKVKPLASNPQFQAYDITLKVTIKNGKIDSVTDVSSNTNQMNKMFLSRAANTIPSSIVKAQSADVDSVSGATCSSKAIMDGVKIALDQAKA